MPAVAHLHNARLHQLPNSDFGPPGVAQRLDNAFGAVERLRQSTKIETFGEKRHDMLKLPDTGNLTFICFKRVERLRRARGKHWSARHSQAGFEARGY